MDPIRDYLSKRVYNGKRKLSRAHAERLWRIAMQRLEIQTRPDETKEKNDA